MRQNNSNSNSGIFGVLFSGWGISAMIFCCVLLLASCFFFMKGKSSTPNTNINTGNPYLYPMYSPTPAFNSGSNFGSNFGPGSFPAPVINSASLGHATAPY
jgi:hypothetical protein